MTYNACQFLEQDNSLQNSQKVYHQIGNKYQLFFREGDKLPEIGDIIDISCSNENKETIGIVLTKVLSIVKHKLDRSTLINLKKYNKTKTKSCDVGFSNKLSDSPLISREYGYLVTTLCINIVDLLDASNNIN